MSVNLENASKEMKSFVRMRMKKAQFEKAKILRKCGFAVS